MMFFDPGKLLLLLLPLITSISAQIQVPLSAPFTTNVTGIPQGFGGGSGQSCDPRKSVLDGLTHRFRSDCNATEWCSPTPIGSQPSNLPQTPASSDSSDDSEESDDDPNDLLGKRNQLNNGNHHEVEEEATFRATGNNGKDDVSTPRAARRDAPSLPSRPVGVPIVLPSVAAPSHQGSVPTTGICVPKKCRRDEYPFGYKGVPAAELPPLCVLGTYCPDEESGCKPFIPLGGTCQLNRDDSCAQTAGAMVPPRLGTIEPLKPGTIFSRSQQMVSSIFRTHQAPFSLGDPRSKRGIEDQALNSNASTIKPLCLGGTCRLASAALGEICIIDHTQYLGYDQNGEEVADVVSRDDCRDSLYCDPTTYRCFNEKQVGESCNADTECLEYNCNQDGICDPAPEAPNKVPGWAFGLIGVAISLVLIAIVTILYKLHLNHRAIRSDEIDRYFSEQWTYRQSILAMHAAAVSSAAEDEQPHQDPFSDSRSGSQLHARKGYVEDGNRYERYEKKLERDYDSEYSDRRGTRNGKERDESGYDSDESEATTIMTPTVNNDGRFVERDGFTPRTGGANRRKPPPTF